MLGFLHHIFIPHSGNNHRAKLLHNSVLFLLLLFFLLVNFFALTIKKSIPEVLGISYSISEQELLTHTNSERQKRGFKPLLINDKLTFAARQKAQDIFTKNYWAHFAPDGTTPWLFIKNANYNYIYAGENLAKGFTDSSEVVRAWMNSPTHRDNMLSDKYTDVGFAIVEGRLNSEETVLVVEMLGSTRQVVIPAAAKPPSTDLLQPIVDREVLPAQKANLELVKANPIIDIHVTSKTLLVFFFSILFFTLFIDFLIIKRKKIPRVVGHNIDHILLIAMFLLYIILEKVGGIM